MRLSKLQKFILVTAYRKTILKDNSTITLLAEWADRPWRKLDDFYWRYLFKEEILLDYFTLEGQSNGINTLQRFKGNNNAAHVSFRRSTLKLLESDLIELYDGIYSRWTGIKLTDKGKELAKNFLSVNGEEILPEG